MQQKELTIEARPATGKGAARKLRAQGKVPGIVYGKGMEAVSVSVEPKSLLAAIAGEGGRNNLITLNGGSLNGSMVIVSELQRDALKGVPVHVDFHKISLTDKIRVQVPVSMKGTAVGVREGGLLDVVMHSLSIECLPTAIPEHLDVDVTQLTIGHSIHVGDLKLPAGIRVLDDSKASIVSVLGRAKEEAPAAPAAS
jgi:large subunit ribosomal protein L25